ncbi:MAG: polysaccharide deacetylase family protein [Saprospiraceae bacterium]|nr:polysaccharide deacetylase family protein [Saprospiraceae bacterium]
MFIAKTPKLLQAFMPAYTWRLDTQERVLYLTFDDGPIPEVTPWVLDTLRPYQAKATFFCVGDNVVKHPAIFQQILEEGHAVGNHTYHHLNGWHTDAVPYLNNVRRCARVVKSRLFRPPYGRLTPRQRMSLVRHFRIIMWDVLSGDYDVHISPQQCLQNVLDHAQPGSIVLMHDSLKAQRNVRFALPAVLEHYAREGYRFEKIGMV